MGREHQLRRHSVSRVQDRNDSRQLLLHALLWNNEVHSHRRSAGKKTARDQYNADLAAHQLERARDVPPLALDEHARVEHYASELMIHRERHGVVRSKRGDYLKARVLQHARGLRRPSVGHQKNGLFLLCFQSK